MILKMCICVTEQVTCLSKYDYKYLYCLPLETGAFSQLQDDCVKTAEI